MLLWIMLGVETVLAVSLAVDAVAWAQGHTHPRDWR